MIRKIFYTVLIILGIMLFVREASSQTIEEEFNGKVYTPQLEYFYKDTGWTKWNIFWATAFVTTSIADVYTSQQALDRGAVEANPIMPESTGGMILFKLIGGGITYYVTEKWFVPRGGPMMRNIVYGVESLIFGAVSIHNNSVAR